MWLTVQNRQSHAVCSVCSLSSLWKKTTPFRDVILPSEIFSSSKSTSQNPVNFWICTTASRSMSQNALCYRIMSCSCFLCPQNSNRRSSMQCSGFSVFSLLLKSDGQYLLKSSIYIITTDTIHQKTTGQTLCSVCALSLLIQNWDTCELYSGFSYALLKSCGRNFFRSPICITTAISMYSK